MMGNVMFLHVFVNRGGGIPRPVVPGPFPKGGGTPVRPVTRWGIPIRPVARGTSVRPVTKGYPWTGLGVPPAKIGVHPPHWIHCGQYASCGHAGGLSCLWK